MNSKTLILSPGDLKGSREARDKLPEGFLIKRAACATAQCGSLLVVVKHKELVLATRQDQFEGKARKIDKELTEAWKLKKVRGRRRRRRRKLTSCTSEDLQVIETGDYDTR